MSQASKPEENSEVSETEKERENHSLNPEKNQEEDQESVGSGIKNFSLGEGDDDEMQLETKK